MVALFAALLLPSSAHAWPWDQKKKADPNIARRKELAVLNQKLQQARDELQASIAKRWQTKRAHVARRVTDKEKLAQLRRAQERAYMEQSRIKEQCFAREKAIKDLKVKTEQRRQGWKVVGLTLKEKLEKEAKRLSGSFPLEIERRRQKLEQARGARARRGSKAVLQGVDLYLAYFRQFLEEGSKVSLSKQTILPENGRAVEVQLARFGSVFAYGMNGEGNAWFLTQTGRLGAGRFAVTPVVSTELKRFLTDTYPKWLAARAVSGTVLADIIQNANSRKLLSGKKLTRVQMARQYLKKGGVVMIPLLALPLWALLIILYKLLQFSLVHRRSGWASRKVVRRLEAEDFDGAWKVVRKKWGAVGRVMRTCLECRDKGRDAAEKAVKEVLARQVPSLNRHLSTLAVIAGAAPLLGLLGTVTGMISLFEVITNYGTGDPKIMASGISEALITTQTGLIIAIPVLLIHNMLRNRKNRLADEMERNAITIMNRLWPGSGA